MSKRNGDEVLSRYPDLLDRRPLSGERVTEWTDAEGRTLAAGDMVRTSRYPRSWRFRIRFLFLPPTEEGWVEAYGPYNERGEPFTADVARCPRYHSFRSEEIVAKCREKEY